MTMYWVYDLPNWLFGLLCIAAFMLFGLAGLYVSRGFVRRIHREDHSHNDIVSYYLAAVTIFYGITLGLLSIGTWTSYNAIQDKVDREAQDLGSLYRDSTSYPEPLRTALLTDLLQYGHEVVDRSWPQQRQGIIPRGSAVYLDDFQQHLLQFQPTNMGQLVIYQETYRQFNDLVESRRSRLDSVTTSIPRSLWWMVLLGAITCIVTTFFFHTRSFSMHVWMTMLMCGLLGLMVFMVATLDNPFRGKISISAAPIERVLQQWDHR